MSAQSERHVVRGHRVVLVISVVNHNRVRDSSVRTKGLAESTASENKAKGLFHEQSMVTGARRCRVHGSV